MELPKDPEQVMAFCFMTGAAVIAIGCAAVLFAFTYKIVQEAGC